MKILLVTGLGRSGSTVIQKILNSHPDIYISDESWQIYNAASMYSSRDSKIMMGMPEHEYARCIAEFLLSLYARVRGAVEIFCDKCPAAFTKIDDIKILTDAIDFHLSIIWTVRHPYDQLLSWIERFQKQALVYLASYGNQHIEQRNNLEQLVESLFTIWKAQQEAMNIHNGYVVAYEKLTDSPAVELQKLHNWLGIDFKETQMHCAFNDKSRGGEKNFNATSSIHTSSRYRYLQEPEANRKILKQAAEKTGILPYFEKYHYQP